MKIDKHIEVISKLKIAKKKIKELRDEISKNVVDQYDKETPYKYLVNQKKAKEIKKEAVSILDKYPSDVKQLEPLNLIRNSCENQGIEWDEYCFKGMPWLGVEPILNAWVKSIEDCINNYE